MSLKSKQLKVIELALEGKSWTQISEDLEVDRSTLWHWRQKPEFQGELARMQEIIFSEIDNRHKFYIEAAFKTLYGQCINADGQYTPEEGGTIRVKITYLLSESLEIEVKYY